MNSQPRRIGIYLSTLIIITLAILSAGTSGAIFSAIQDVAKPRNAGKNLSSTAHPLARETDAGGELADEEKREKRTMERFLTLLEKTPRRGTAVDRVYGYHVERGSLEGLIKTYRDRVTKDKGDAASWMIIGLLESQRGGDAAAVEAFARRKRRSRRTRCRLIISDRLLSWSAVPTTPPTPSNARSRGSRLARNCSKSSKDWDASTNDRRNPTRPPPFGTALKNSFPTMCAFKN